MKKYIILLCVVLVGTMSYIAHSFPPTPPPSGTGMYTTDIDTFSELDTIVADKSLTNTADNFTWSGIQTYTGENRFKSGVTLEGGVSAYVTNTSVFNVWNAGTTEVTIDNAGIHATAYFGDGSNLDGVGSIIALNNDFTGTNSFHAGVSIEAGVSVDVTNTTRVNVWSSGSTTVTMDNAGIHATAYYGDGSNLSGMGSGDVTQAGDNTYTGENDFSQAGVTLPPFTAPIIAESGLSVAVSATSGISAFSAGSTVFQVDASGLFATVGYLSPLDPDELIGDTVDDNLIDPEVLNITSMDIYINGAIATDNTYSGSAVTGIKAGEAISFGQVVFMKQDPNDATVIKWFLADCCESEVSTPAYGFAIETASAAGEIIGVLQQGTIRDNDWTSMTTGYVYYLSDTSGGITNTPIPSNSGETVQPLGRALGQKTLLINVDPVQGYSKVD